MGWLEDRYKGTQTVGSDGKVDGRGLGAFLWQQFVDEDAINKGEQRSLNTKAALAEGENINDLAGIDDTSGVYDVKGAAVTARRERETAATEKAHTRGLEATMAPIKAQLEANAEANKTSAQLTREKMAQQNSIQLMQLSQQNDARVAELQYQKMRDRKADRQYNERMEKLDRRDRRTAIQGMVSGLAALGAAFAV